MASFGAEVYTTVNAFANHSETFTKDTTYFSDVNGDGLTDLVNDGTVLFNHLDANGVPTFTANSSDTPVPIGAGILDTNGLVADYTASRDQQDTNNPPADVARRWVAPFTGTVKVTGNAALIQDTSATRASYTGADGVRVAIQKNTAELWSTTIGATDYAAKTPTGVASIAVTKGDRLYFRVGSRSDGAYDQVSWDPVVQYVKARPARHWQPPRTPTVWMPTATRHRRTSPWPAGAAPTCRRRLNGTVRLAGVLHKLAATSDDLTVQVTKNGQVAASWAITAASTGDTTTQSGHHRRQAGHPRAEHQVQYADRPEQARLVAEPVLPQLAGRQQGHRRRRQPADPAAPAVRHRQLPARQPHRAADGLDRARPRRASR